jgi:Xaa-Pro dipeptidase
MVDAAFAGFCELVDASDLVRMLRLVKTPAELAYFRQAGRLVDEACAVSQRLTVPGASVGAVYRAYRPALALGAARRRRPVRESMAS